MSNTVSTLNEIRKALSPPVLERYEADLGVTDPAEQGLSRVI